MSAPTAARSPLTPTTGRHVIEVRHERGWQGRYEISTDGERIATWEKSLWGSGGTFKLGGCRFRVHVNLIAGSAHLTRAGGVRVATASGIGRKNWTIEADGTIHHFRRASPWRREQRLHDAGRTLGRIRPTGLRRGNAAADLPGMPVTTQVFALTLALTTWDAEAAATG